MRKSHILIDEKYGAKRKINHGLLNIIIDYTIDLIDYELHKNENPNSQKRKPTKDNVLIN